MFKDDDEEEENTFGVTRYPCMPSLVALQQMRNRLHLAFLGRKLMKWTALATGRELRRLAQELYEVYDGFAEDLRNAFILLARSRYFCPNLNSVVSEDIAKKAAVLVQQCNRTVSGVKIVQFELFETEYPPYPHLGLEKGGQTILETKKAWLELLKRLIMMMQLRAGFLMVELANKNANKKMNVLAKIVIPRTNVTVGYINNELEELAREEFFRLKKILEIKRRMYGEKNSKKKGKGDDLTCPICIDEAKALKEEAKILQEVKSIEQEFVEEKEEITDQHLSELIKQISEIVDVTKDMDKRGLVTASVDNFIKTAEELKAKLMSNSKPEVKIEKLGQELDESILNELEQDKLDEYRCIHPMTEDDLDLNKLCEACREKYKGKKKEGVVFEDEELEEPPKAIESKESMKSKQSTTQDTYIDESDAELGTFVTEFKEITKIFKTKNEDGSISIQRKVIKIQREIRTPVRSQSSQGPSQNNSTNPSENVSYQPSTTSSGKSNPYSGSRTIGVVTVSSSEFKDKLPVPNIIAKKAKSEILSPFSPMSDPVERFCMSSVTLLSTDLDFDYVIYNDTNNKPNPDLLCLKASNPMIEEIISSYEPGFCNTSMTTNTENSASKSSTMDINLDHNNELSSEHRPHKEIGNFSFSESNCTKKCSKKLGLSVSFNIKSPSSSAILDESNNKNK